MSRKLIIYDDFFNEYGLSAINDISKELFNSISPNVYAKNGYPLIDQTMQQLFESLLGQPVFFYENSGVLVETNVKNDSVHAWSSDWFAVLPLNKSYLEDECLKLLTKNNQSKYEFSKMEKNINKTYTCAQIVTSNSVEDFEESITIPFKNNRLILIEGNLWHSVNFKDNGRAVIFFIGKGQNNAEN